MTMREIHRAERLLSKIGRVVTGIMINTSGKRPSKAIATDGDGRRTPFGCPKIFYTLDEVKREILDI